MALNISELNEATELVNTDILHLRAITSLDKKITANNLSIGLRAYLDKSVAYTILDTDINPIIFSTTGASAFTYDLPTLADNLHKVVRLMKVDAGAGTAILDGEGGETINGTPIWTITEQFGYVEVIALASGWFVLDQWGCTFKMVDTSAHDNSSTSWAQKYTLTGLTAGTYDIRYSLTFELPFDFSHQSGFATIASTADTEDDAEYSIKYQPSVSGSSGTGPSEVTLGKQFIRAFGSAVTLYLNIKTLVVSGPPSRIDNAVVSGLIYAIRIA